MKKIIYFLSGLVLFCLIYVVYNLNIISAYLNGKPESIKRTSFVNNKKLPADTGFVFPKDHGAHNDFNSEWWYYSGNLSVQNGRKFGYELAIFRIAGTFNANTNKNDYPDDQKYMAHFAITDVADTNFYYKENLSLSSGINAGANTNPFKVWLGDWIVDGNYINNNFLKPNFHIQASTKYYSVDLNLNNLKQLVLQGEKGISRKGPAKNDYSHYYSFTRLSTSGKVQVKGVDYNVSGLSWMDHEWSNSEFERNDNRWDWFSIQLNNSTEIMFYQLRNKDGGRSIYSKGAIIFENGKTRTLRPEEVKIESVGYWESKIHIRYPSGWKFSVPNRDIFLKLTPFIKNQELELVVNYWEGAVSVKGKCMNKEISGNGYVELTGYKPEINFLH